jgi:hypothetical protein
VVGALSLPDFSHVFCFMMYVYHELLILLIVDLGRGLCGNETVIVGPGYQPGCIILRVGNLAD